MNKLTARISAVLAAAALGTCGGGSGGGSAAGGAPTTTTPIVTTGTITGFGSVYVNGVRYDTSRASVYKDDDRATENDLRIGQIVRVRGSVAEDGGSGRADRIDFDDNVEAPIDSIDLTNGVMVALGQTVLVSGDTSFDDDISPRSLAGLAVGDLVEVSGFVDSTGRILATRIERDDDGGPYEVTGKVAELDTVARRFTIGGLRVGYSAAMLEDFPSGAPSTGDTVEVKGTQVTADGTLLATKVELEFDSRGRSRDNSDDDHDIEIEGLITRFVDATDFDVAGRPVRTTSTTRYEDGVVGDLATDVKVEVEGQYDAQGVLIAEKVDFKRDNAVRLEGPVTAIDASGAVSVLRICALETGWKFAGTRTPQGPTRYARGGSSEWMQTMRSRFADRSATRRRPASRSSRSSSTHRQRRPSRKATSPSALPSSSPGHPGASSRRKAPGMAPGSALTRWKSKTTTAAGAAAALESRAGMP